MKVSPIFLIVFLIVLSVVITGSESDKLENEEVEINYKNNNMTIEFKEGGLVIGEATLKSHTTYNEIRKVTTGKNKVVVWYEFTDFKEDYLRALKEVEFIDMREFIENKSYTSQFKEDEFEKIDESRILINNPNYLMPIEKNYTFVYQDKEGKWLSYDSFDIPKENIIIGVQTDLFWGEFIDVVLDIFDNKLDKHSLVIGTSAGFVEDSPEDDPEGLVFLIDAYSYVFKDTSPATATTITEIGWWCDSATEEANFEVGLYAADGDVVPNEAGTRLYVDNINAKGTDVGWKKVTGLEWEIESSTDYWLGVQLDNTATLTNTNREYSGGAGYDRRSGQTSLTNPYGGGSIYDSNGIVAIYAVWEGESDTCTYSGSGDWIISDDCIIETDTDVQGNDIIMVCPDTIVIDAVISNYGTKGVHAPCKWACHNIGEGCWRS